MNDRTTPPTTDYGSDLGHGQPWATLAAPSEQTEPQPRQLRLGVILFDRAGASGDQPAYNSVRLRFELEGFPSFVRRLSEPLRIEDGWLVVRDIGNGGVAHIVRMSDAEWRAFQHSKCPTDP